MRKIIIVILILLKISDVLSNEKKRTELVYSASVDLMFDSNIGQNINEENAIYVVPRLYFKLKDFTALPWYIKTNFVYDAYQQNRVPTLASPFVKIGTGFDFKKKQFSYKPELSALLYLAMNVDKVGDNYEDVVDVESFVSVKRSIRLTNNVIINLKENKISILNYIRRNDYGEDAIEDSRDEWRIGLKPVFKHKFRILKKDKVKIKSISTYFEYEGNFSIDESENFHLIQVALGLDFKLLRMSLHISPALSQKKYTLETTHPHDDEIKIIPNNKYFKLESNLNIPIISDLKFVIGGKVRFKNSNNPMYDYNRNTCYARLKWESSVGGMQK